MGILRFWVEPKVMREDSEDYISYVYVVTEDRVMKLRHDPEDGYRSTCQQEEIDPILFWLKVKGGALTEFAVPYDSIQYDIVSNTGDRNISYDILAWRGNQKVFMIGTDHSDDYYPSFIMQAEGKDWYEIEKEVEEWNQGMDMTRILSES